MNRKELAIDALKKATKQRLGILNERISEEEFDKQHTNILDSLSEKDSREACDILVKYVNNLARIDLLSSEIIVALIELSKKGGDRDELFSGCFATYEGILKSLNKEELSQVINRLNQFEERRLRETEEN